MVGQEVFWVRGSGTGRKRIRLNRKTPAHLAAYMVQCRPRVWKMLRHVGFSSVSIPDHKRRRGDQDNGGSNPAQVRGNSLGLSRPTSPGLHAFLISS